MAQESTSGFDKVPADGLAKQLPVSDELHAIAALLSKTLVFGHGQAESTGDDPARFPRLPFRTRDDDIGTTAGETAGDLPRRGATGSRQLPCTRFPMRIYLWFGMTHHQDRPHDVPPSDTHGC